MNEELLQEQPEEQGLYIGRRLISWVVDEYPRHSRGRLWYAATGVLGAVLIVYAIATANFLFAVIVLMIGVITLVSTFKEPDEVDVIITTTGILIGTDYYEYKQLKDFAIVYEPPEVKLLYLDFHSMIHPLVSVPLEDVDPNVVREQLLPYVAENLNRNEEHLTDVLQRLYKL